MKHDERLWELVQAALDERRDPLADARVQEQLAAEPERLEELLALRERLQLVGGAARPRRSRRVAAAAALVLAGLGLIAAAFLLRGGSGSIEVAHGASVPNQVAEAPAEAPVSDSGPASASRVLAFRAEVTHETPNGRTVTVFDGSRTRRSRESFDRSSATQAPRFVAVVESLSFTR